MGDCIRLEDLEIIGTTSVGVSLPKRQSPIYRLPGDKETCFFTVQEDGVERPVLSPEPIEWFREMVANGDALEYDVPIPARLGHCVVQMEEGKPPEYMPKEDLQVRLTRAAREALEAASRALSQGRRDLAESLAGYAWRASPDDPLPVLVLIALLRHEVDPEELRFLESDLEEFPRSVVEAAYRRAHTRAELHGLSDLLEEPPQSGARPTYFERVKERPAYLDATRDAWARAVATAPRKRRTG